ncbi:MAG: Asp-tRNA(Asn)/Glu-tRNA(Gln) amidotransferase subunit GatC [Pseudomonadota bacterium]|jgi:aspartyl-tRNA(Asn)/glutamyl-tRNA(Gln) amidotransferase subunit C|nr:Asp-tRNA(Asn)/Glu-tRNA(Gln) amidotransferase subunit GatC [Pseudomonadota bacterium]|tara:strand:- start:998 stop:1285 length:288 start_codon:yes stop_codon:yes gene_type:complete
MSLDKSEVQKIAWLARLAIDKDDIASYCDELTDILDLMEQMNSIDTTDIVPLAHPLEVFPRLRVDNVTEIDQRENFQADSSKTKDGYYIVPKVIE